MSLDRRDSSWGSTQSTVPILCTLAVFVAVSVGFILFGIYQRRRFNQRMLQGGFPADWDGLNWALLPRRRASEKGMGPQPKLTDAVLRDPTAVEGSGNWTGIVPLTVQLEPYPPTPPPNAMDSERPNAAFTPPLSRSRTRWSRFILPSRSRERSIFTSHPGILAEKGPLSVSQLGDTIPRIADVVVLIAMPTPSHEADAVGHSPQFVGLALGITPAIVP